MSSNRRAYLIAKHTKSTTTYYLSMGVNADNAISVVSGQTRRHKAHKFECLGRVEGMEVTRPEGYIWIPNRIATLPDS